MFVSMISTSDSEISTGIFTVADVFCTVKKALYLSKYCTSMQITYRIREEMVFLTEFINGFFAAGELCAVHIVDQENSTCRQTFMKTAEAQRQSEHRGLHPEIRNRKLHL